MTRRESRVETEAWQSWPVTGRGELIAIAAVVLLAGALRFAYPSRLAVEHFDEGVYASNIWFGEASDYRYPARHLYAPPLLPALIEWSIILFGVGPISVKLVILLAGTATVGAVWWVGRRWFGREAGMAAAVLAALSDVHIVYSRMALTDVLMCLWLLIAVGCVHEMLVRGRQGWAVAAGLVTGLAWATKYNGWLPVAIAVSGFVLYALVSRWKLSKRPMVWRGFAVSLSLMVVTAAVVWSPVWFDLQDRGGYAAVAANHRGYLVGWGGWWDSLVRQVGNHQYLEQWFSFSSISVAMLAATIVAAVSVGKFEWTWTRSNPLFVIGLALFLTGLTGIIGVSVVLGLLTVIGVVTYLIRMKTADKQTLPCCLLAVWFVGLLLATPLYFPYPRLTLPWLMSAWLGGGAVLVGIVRPASGTQSEGDDAQRDQRWAWLSVGMLVLGCVAVIAGLMWFTLVRTFYETPTWRSQSGLRQIAAEVAQDIRTESPHSEVLIQVYAEPALFFYLAAEGDSRMVTVPVGSLKPPAGPATVATYLVTGPNAHRESGYAATIAAFGDRLEEVAEFAYQPSDVVQLNSHSARELKELKYSRAGDERVRLYRVR